jgi:hypothetical protein
MPTSSNRLVTVPEGKRSKLETETSTSTRSGSHDQHERPVNMRLSTAMTDPPAGQYGPGSTPPLGPARLPTGPSYPSKPSSPASHSLSGFNSPRGGELYSPVSASPRLNAFHKDATFDTSSGYLAREARGNPDTTVTYHPTAYMHSHQLPLNTATPTNHLVSHYQAPMELPSRRSIRDPSSRLPGLTHEDTTISSESGHSNYSLPQPAQPSSMDSTKSLRMLPQPVPSIGTTKSPLDRTLPHLPPGPSGHMQLAPPDYRASGSLAALVRAGEIAARVADEESIERDDSS